jgi:hypothetical protein
LPESSTARAEAASEPFPGPLYLATQAVSTDWAKRGRANKKTKKIVKSNLVINPPFLKEWLILSFSRLIYAVFLSLQRFFYQRETLDERRETKKTSNPTLPTRWGLILA